MLWAFRFVMIIIVVGGIIALVSILYSKQIDIRQIEANEINEKLFTCNLFNEINFDKTSLDKCIVLGNEGYVNLTLIFSDKSKKSVFTGDSSMEETCRLIEQYEIKPLCQESIYYILFNNKPTTLKVLVGIKKTEKNAL